MIGKAKTTLVIEEEKAVIQPKFPDRVALVDADTIAYAVCSVCEYGDDESGYQIDMQYAIDTAVSKIDNILQTVSCGSIELHFTMGKNFRFTVNPTYKSNRTERTPEGLKELKLELNKLYPGAIHTDIESDDYVVWAKKYNPEKYILCAVDKDVLNSVAGEHFNYYQNEKYNIKPKWETVLDTRPLPWFYLQVLMGDAGDGIPGLPGIAGLKAFDILAPQLINKRKELAKEWKTNFGKAPSDPFKAIIIGKGLIDEVSDSEEELYCKVVAAYESAGLTEKDVINTARLVSMHQLNEKGELELWIQPNLTKVI